MGHLWRKGNLPITQAIKIRTGKIRETAAFRRLQRHGDYRLCGILNGFFEQEKVERRESKENIDFSQ
jgi:hypothetical protein